MNLLYSRAEDEKNIWNYGGEIGIIPKSSGGGSSEKDAEQDQKIDSNTHEIEDVKHSLEENESRDDEQQRQIDANAQAIADNNEVDRQQQGQLDANDALDVQQQSQIDYNRSELEDTIRRLNENIANDSLQQDQINANSSNIIRVEGELPTLDMEGTTLVIGKKGET